MTLCWELPWPFLIIFLACIPRSTSENLDLKEAWLRFLFVWLPFADIFGWSDPNFSPKCGRKTLQFFFFHSLYTILANVLCKLMITSLFFILEFCARIVLWLFFWLFGGLFFDVRPHSIVVVIFLLEFFFVVFFLNMPLFLFFLIFLMLFESLAGRLFRDLFFRLLLCLFILFLIILFEKVESLFVWNIRWHLANYNRQLNCIAKVSFVKLPFRHFQKSPFQCSDCRQCKNDRVRWIV